MMVPVLSRSGEQTGREIELPDAIFNIEPNEHVMWLAAKVFQSNLRQGSHAHKNRCEVSGGGRKPFRQKGTGRARQGTSRAPQMRGGGKVFGPEPHHHTLGLPLKVRRLAKQCALSTKARDAEIMVVEDFSPSAPKTKEIAAFIGKCLPEQGAAACSILLLTSQYEPVLLRSCRNIPRLRIERATVASAYDIMRSRLVILQEGAVAPLVGVLNRG